MGEQVHVITPSARPHNLPRIAAALQQSLGAVGPWHWWVVLDLPPTSLSILGIRELVGRMPNLTIWFHHAPTPGAWGHPQRSAALDHIRKGWVWTCDDDNVPHPAFGQRLAELIAAHPLRYAFVFDQQRRDGRRLVAAPENLRPEGVDTAQYVCHRSLIADERVRPVPADDGGFIQRIYQRSPESFVFVNEALTYHNWLQEDV